MARSKVAAVKAVNHAQVKPITSVKDGAITKPSQTPKSKSKEIAKQVAVKADKLAKKDKATRKSKKEPTPEPSASESESESDESATSASSESSDDEPESKSESKLAAASNGFKSNGAVKSAAEDEDESSESSDSSDDGPVTSEPKLFPATAKKNGALTQSSDSEEESDIGGDSEEDSEVSSEDESDEELAVPGAVDSKALNGALKKVVASQQASSADNSDSSDSSGSGSDSEESIEEEVVASKKRKADSEVVPAAKKTKTTTGGEDGGPKNLFVGQLSWNVDEDWLTREFERFGELSSVRVISDKNTGRSKGFGYVEFVNSTSAAKAQKELHGTSIDNRAINVDFSNPRADAGGAGGGYKERSKTYGDQRSPASDTLFVANIAFEATENVIAEEFGKHGSVISVRLPTSMDDGNPKGFGYVQFSSVEEASDALNNMAGASICGRPIRLDFSTPRPNNNADSPRGGRGGRGRGGFDRGGRGGGRGRGGFDRGDRGGRGGGRGSSTNRGGFGDFKGKKVTF